MNETVEMVLRLVMAGVLGGLIGAEREYRGKVAGGIYDDRFLVKNVASASALMPDSPLEIPYEGGTPMLLVDDVENRKFLAELFEAMYDELPQSKKKAKK